MARRGPTIRLAKWDANFIGTHVPGKVTPRKTELYGRMQNAIGTANKIELITKLILAEAATSTITSMWYVAFAREVAKARTMFSGGQLLGAVNVLLNKYVAQGLDQDILEKIRNTCFTLAPPTP